MSVPLASSWHPLLAGLLAVGLGGMAQAQMPPAASGHAEIPEVDAAVVAQLSLPPVPPTRMVIAGLPQVQVARAGMAVAQARGQRLQAGTYEWTVKAGVQQRRETAGPIYNEGEFALERGIRWGNKAQTDRDLGDAGVAAGQSSYADVWHEAVRGLLLAWYDWQRGRSATRVQTQQAELAREQLDVAARRVRAGDAPRMDQLMAQAELDRAAAAQQQASGRERVLLQDLQKRFPGLLTEGEIGASDAVPLESLLPGDAQTWISRIVENNHEIELSEAEVRVARLHSQRAQLDTSPDPLLGVRAANERGGQENILGVYVTVPLSGALRAADQRAALALADAAEQRLIQTRQRVEAAAQRVVLQAGQNAAVWQRLEAVRQSMDSVARLSIKAYGLGEMTLTEALQARRAALESALAADAARWDALESVSRVLVDAHRLWAADEHAP
jgi:outer membrane protein, heavy metal efflux system